MMDERVYRALLRLYPPSFRHAFEDDMVELFRHLRTRLTPVELTRRVIWDLTLSLPREWLGRARTTLTPSPKGNPMNGFVRDLELAIRSTTRNAGTTALGLAILAIGFGASLTTFVAVNGVVLRPLPYPEPDRIVRLWANHHEDAVERFSFTKIEFRAYAERSETFEVVGGDFAIDLTLTGGDGEPERLGAALTTPGYFEVYGAVPIHGRWFTFEDVDSENARIAVVSHGLWTRRFGADPDLVGDRILLDGNPFTVVGVLPSDYRHVTSDVDVFIPFTLGTTRWIGRWLELSARLRPGVSVAQAEAEIAAITAALAEEQGRSRGWTMTVEPLVESTLGSARFAMWAAFGAVALLFALTAVNVTSLVLARAATRQHDVDLRAALGAGPFERVRPAVLENLVTGALGLGAGVALAAFATPHLLALGVESLPRLSTFDTDQRVVLFGIAVALSTLGVLAGAPLAFAATRAARTRAFSFAGRSPGGLSLGTARLLGGLVVMETALAVAILAGAGLLMRTYLELASIDPGFEAKQTVAMTIALPGARYPEAASRIGFFDQLQERFAGLPETVSTSVSAYLPLEGLGALSFLNSEERVARGEPRISSLQRIVSGSYFRTLRVPLLTGDTFPPRRPDGAPPQIILGEALARQLFGAEDPVGKRVTSSAEPGPDDWREVVGVVGDVRYVELAEPPQAQFYEAFEDRAWGTMAVLTHTTSPIETFVAAARDVVSTLDPEVPVFQVKELESVARGAAARPRFNMVVFTVFAGVALALAAAGIYGVLSFVSARRTREIGVRMAFGATREQVLSSFVTRAARLSALGASLGLVLAGFAFQGLRSLLFGVSPYDPLTAACVVASLLATGVVAAYLPARRASRLDPMEALRQE